jgi:hypothetical protein
MMPGDSASKPRAMPRGVSMRKLIHRIWSGVKGMPAAISRMVATRNVATNVTSVMRMKRTYLVRLS